MAVRVISAEQRGDRSPERDYLQVRTFRSPDDDTVTLATIQRFVDLGGDIEDTGTTWRVRTLVLDKPMTQEQAVSFATRYAERKHIPLVVRDDH